MNNQDITTITTEGTGDATPASSRSYTRWKAYREKPEVFSCTISTNVYKYAVFMRFAKRKISTVNSRIM